MEIKNDLDIVFWQNILNILQLHILASFFIDIVMHLIEVIFNSSLSFSSFFLMNKLLVSQKKWRKFKQLIILCLANTYYNQLII